MSKSKHIIYGALWVAYIFCSFLYFPVFNINILIPSIILFGLGAWLWGSETTLTLFLFLLFYYSLLFDYFGDILEVYPAKAFGVCAIVTVIMLVGAFKRQHGEVKQLSAILDQKVSERTEELNQLIEQLIADDENIRRSLGQDIHDGLGQNLTGLLLFSSSLQDDLEQEHSIERPRINNIVARAQKNLHLARKISRTLFPFKMMETGLETALDELSSYFSEAANIPIRINLNSSETKLSDTVIIHFYRIIYECILNTLHHDTATLIEVVVNTDQKKQYLQTRIWGCNKPEEILNKVFVELICYRVKLIRGQLDTEILPNGDLIIRCTAPLAGL